MRAPRWPVILLLAALVVLVLGCHTERAEPTAPDETTLTLRVACASVWTIEVDDQQVNTEGRPAMGALWYFPASGLYRLPLEPGDHLVTLLRWHPTVSAGIRTIASPGDTLELICGDALQPIGLSLFQRRVDRRVRFP